MLPLHRISHLPFTTFADFKRQNRATEDWSSSAFCQGKIGLHWCHALTRHSFQIVNQTQAASKVHKDHESPAQLDPLQLFYDGIHYLPSTSHSPFAARLGWPLKSVVFFCHVNFHINVTSTHTSIPILVGILQLIEGIDSPAICLA